jgi:hypothetical protein
MWLNGRRPTDKEQWLPSQRERPILVMCGQFLDPRDWPPLWSPLPISNRSMSNGGTVFLNFKRAVSKRQS